MIIKSIRSKQHNVIFFAMLASTCSMMLPFNTNCMRMLWLSHSVTLKQSVDAGDGAAANDEEDEERSGYEDEYEDDEGDENEGASWTEEAEEAARELTDTGLVRREVKRVTFQTDDSEDPDLVTTTGGLRCRMMW
jgi:hypothetical protein